MTTTVTRTIINQSPGTFGIQLLIQSDGSDGELVNYPIWDPVADSDPPINAWHPEVQVCSLMQVWRGLSWFDVVVGFNALEPMQAWVIVRDANPYEDFRFFGGIFDRSGVQRDGKILISTIGMAGVISIGSLVLTFKKNQ